MTASASTTTIEISVFDKGLHHISTWPTNDDRAFPKHTNFVHHLLGLKPNVQFFDAIKQDDPKRLLFGPIGVRANALDPTVKPKDMAIYEFMRNHMRFPCDENTKYTNIRHLPAPAGKRDVFWICSHSIDDPETMKETVRHFHRHEEKLYHSQFCTVLPRERPDLAVCKHTVAAVTIDGKSPAFVAINDHITKCLERKEGSSGLEQPERENWYELTQETWLSKFANSKREAIGVENWVRFHPHFRHCNYRKTDGFIPLDASEVNQLNVTQRDLVERMEGKCVTEKELRDCRVTLGPLLIQMRDDYQLLGYDTSGFSHLQEWSAYEMIKTIVSPPLPRSARRIIEDPETKAKRSVPGDRIPFSNEDQQLGFLLREQMKLVSDEPPLSPEELKAQQAAAAAGTSITKSGKSGGRGGRGGRGGAARGRGGRSKAGATAEGKRTTDKVQIMLLVRVTKETEMFMAKMQPTRSHNKKFFLVTSSTILPFLNHISKQFHWPVEGLLKSMTPTRIGQAAFLDLIPRNEMQLGSDMEEKAMSMSTSTDLD